jgi:NAD(P)-dependent dehydrogenase (short-subunit alcohol dehydrogenase family)
MKIDLTGKTALVTGSTAGIGQAAAVGLAEAGATVIVNGRSDRSVEAALGRLRQRLPGAKVRGVAADLGTAEGCAALVAAEPAVDILVNNAGIFELVDFFAADDATWDRHWQVNVMAGVRLSRAYLPGMRERGWGRVIFLSSESGLNIPVEMIHYGVSKTADIAVARGLAKRMAGTGVTVNSVLPGPTMSEGVIDILQKGNFAGASLDEKGKDFVMKARPTTLLRRPATVEEVANLIVYLASPQASATTGAAMRVDGGVVDAL